MKKINLNYIRGKYMDLDVNKSGDDTVPSLKKLATRINELIDEVEKLKVVINNNNNK